MKKTIIITGPLGQDGLILSKILLKNKKYRVIGVVKKKEKKRTRTLHFEEAFVHDVQYSVRYFWSQKNCDMG